MSYVAASGLASTISGLSQPVDVLQKPTNFNWAIPKQSSSVQKIVQTYSKKTSYSSSTQKKVSTPAPVVTKPTNVVIQQVTLPSSFDANGVLRIRTVGGSEIVEMLVKTKTGGYIGVPYYGLGNFVTFSSAPSIPKKPTTGTGTTVVSTPSSSPVYIPIGGG